MNNTLAFLTILNRHFQVNYDINPWMHCQQRNVNIEKAEDQYNALLDLIDIDGHCVYFDIDDELIPDIVFTANAGIVNGDKVLLSNFYYPERKRETPQIKRVFEQLGFKPEEIDKPSITFEGAGDCLLDVDRNIAWMGFGFRTSLHAKSYVEKFYGDDVMVRPLRLINPNFYHLDTCFCPLSDGRLLYYPRAFDEHSIYLINTWYQEKAIVVEPEEANDFVCNAVEINKTIIVNRMSKRLKTILENLGYKIVETPLTEFIKSGGSAKCLTLLLNPRKYGDQVL